MAKNLVTVFIPCYNAAEYIEECIDSILNQTFQDFSILIIDDGSTDGSVKCIEAMADKRIRLVRNDKNLGIVGVLNKGFDLVETPYMVRQDADDISFPNRLEKLVAFMEGNLDIDICGCGLLTMPGNKVIIHPEKHNEICAKLLQHTAITHGSSIFRMESMNGSECRYEAEFAYAEDFRFFTKYWRTLKYANLKEQLYKYRVHDEQISTTKSVTQTAIHNKALGIYVGDLLGLKIEPIEATNYFRPVTSKIAKENFNKLIAAYTKVADRASIETKNVLRSNIKRIVRHSKLPIWYRIKGLFWYYLGLKR